MKKNAIIGLAFNYSNSQIHPFLKSLDDSGFDGDLILYVNNQSNIKNYKYRFNIVLINFERDNYRKIWFFSKIRIRSSFLSKILSKIVKRSVSDSLKIHASLNNWILSYFYDGYYLATVRFVLYYSLISNSNYDNIFLTDVNDVIFQGDVFEDISIDKLHCYEENNKVMLGEEFYNSNWIISGYGAKVYWDMRENVILCSGTILGSSNSVVKFLSDYTNHIINNNFPAYVVGLDQGIFNYLVNYEKLPYCIKHINGDKVFTLGTVPREGFIIMGKKINSSEFDNKTPAVLHQYNRHADLVNHMKDLYNQ